MKEIAPDTLKKDFEALYKNEVFLAILESIEEIKFIGVRTLIDNVDPIESNKQRGKIQFAEYIFRELDHCKQQIKAHDEEQKH